MKIKSSVLLTLFLYIFIVASASSYKVKKLLNAFAKENNPLRKSEIYIDVANEIKGSNPDSALYYFTRAEVLSQSFTNREQKELIRVRVLVGRASVEIARGNFEKAWLLDSVALNLVRVLKNSEQEAAVLMSRGSICYGRSQFDEAQQCNREALRINRTTGDRITEGKILTNMGTIEFMFGNAKKADSLFRIPIKLAEASHNDDLLAAGLLNIGLLNVYGGDYPAAEGYIRKSAAIYQRIDGKDGLVLCYQNLANIWMAQGNTEKTIEYSMLNFNLSMELGDKTGLGKALQNLGECYSQIGDYEKAIEYFIKGLKIKTELGDTKEIAITNSSIGHMNYMQGDLKRALGYYRQSLKDYEKIGYVNGMAASYGDIGNILAEQNNGDSALYYFRKSEDIYARNEQPDYLANVYLNVGKVYFSRKNYQQAANYYRKAEEIKNQLGDRIGSYNLLSLFAAMYLSKSPVMGRPVLDTALRYAQRAFRIADSMNYLPGKRESAGYLMDIYSKLGNTTMALQYARIKLESSDSLNKKQRAEAIINAEIRWHAERKQTEISRLEQQKELQAKVIDQQSALAGRLMAMIVAIFLVLVLMVVVAVLYLKNKARQKDVEYQKHLNEVTRLKMQNLGNRLSPHLFFNMLGSVSGDAADPEKVRLQVKQVADLLRMSLENAERTVISLAEELEMVKLYVELQGARIPRPFSVAFTIEETVDREILIPSMMLQVPVENAIKHGLMPLEGEKILDVTIRKVDKSTEIVVTDNGIGRQQSKGRTPGTGTGLRVLLQTIRLLNQQNKEPVSFLILDREPAGTIVKINIPENFTCQPENV
ncbi:MAG: tetratricopeptide repeat protein [Bacteroidales bacterium]